MRRMLEKLASTPAAFKGCHGGCKKAGIEIINTTIGSAIMQVPIIPLDEVLKNDR